MIVEDSGGNVDEPISREVKIKPLTVDRMLNVQCHYLSGEVATLRTARVPLWLASGRAEDSVDL